MRGLGALKVLLARCRDAVARRGPAYSLKAGVKIAADFAASRFWRAYFGLFKLKRLEKLEFMFDGERYGYFFHPYNTTYRSERAIEIPIAARILKSAKGKAVLEVGNVLSHYMPVSHDVLDRYESADGIVNLLEGYDPGQAKIINLDVCDFNPGRLYDLIISISTLEHIGWDDSPKVPEKAGAAIRHLAGLLSEGGRMVVTFPLGHNLELDRLVRRGEAGFSRALCMKRISKDNEWRQAELSELESVQYGRPFPAANGLVVGFVEPAA